MSGAFPVVQAVEPSVQMGTLLEMLIGTDYDDIVAVAAREAGAHLYCLAAL